MSLSLMFYVGKPFFRNLLYLASGTTTNIQTLFREEHDTNDLEYLDKLLIYFELGTPRYFVTGHVYYYEWKFSLTSIHESGCQGYP